MNELKYMVNAALLNTPSEKFSEEERNTAVINKILEAVGLDKNVGAREINRKENEIFAIIEESIDEILPEKLKAVLGQFAEVKKFGRDEKVVFSIDKVGKSRAKLVISKSARNSIYRAAKLSNREIEISTENTAAAVFVTAEELMLGKVSLSELFQNILEGFEEIVYTRVFDALCKGKSVGGYDAITSESLASVTKATLGTAIDSVMPRVKQYGMPMIFGFYNNLSHLYNPVANTTGHVNIEDSADIRNNGFINIYKGAKIVELPNYLIEGTDQFAYDDSYVFVIPAGVKPVKVGLQGDLVIQKNADAVGDQKWEAHKLVGVALVMGNNYASIKVTGE